MLMGLAAARTPYFAHKISLHDTTSQTLAKFLHVAASLVVETWKGLFGFCPMIVWDGNGVRESKTFFSCDQAPIWLVQSVCLSVRLSVCPSVRPSHLFHHVPIIVSSWHFQEFIPMTKVPSMQKVKVGGQRSRSQRSTPNLTVSGL